MPDAANRSAAYFTHHVVEVDKLLEGEVVLAGELGLSHQRLLGGGAIWKGATRNQQGRGRVEHTNMHTHRCSTSGRGRERRGGRRGRAVSRRSAHPLGGVALDLHRGVGLGLERLQAAAQLVDDAASEFADLVHLAAGWAGTRGERGGGGGRECGEATRGDGWLGGDAGGGGRRWGLGWQALGAL